MIRRWGHQISALAGCLALTGCRGMQSSLDPAGTQASRIEGAYHLYFWICLIVYVAVMAFLVVAIVRGKRLRRVSIDPDPIRHPDPQRERRLARFVSSAVGLTVIILFVLLISDFAAGRAIHSLSSDPN